jgi:hypothetical protein
MRVARSRWYPRRKSVRPQGLLVKIGDVATVFDWTEGSRPEDFGVASKAPVCDLAMHLNPLIRRRLT